MGRTLTVVHVISCVLAQLVTMCCDAGMYGPMGSDPWGMMMQHRRQKGDKKRRKSSNKSISSSKVGKSFKSSPHNSAHSHSSKDEKQSLQVESVCSRDDATGCGGQYTAPPTCLAEGAGSPCVPEVAIPEITPAAPRKGAEMSNVSLDGVARVPVIQGTSQPDKKGWFRWGKKTTASNSEQAREGNTKSLAFSDRQVVQLLGPTSDLTRGKGDHYGVKAVSGNRSLKEHDEAMRSKEVLKQRKKTEAEKGGLFQRGQIREHAALGPRKFGVSCGCF
jgi:hypothetical protein